MDAIRGEPLLLKKQPPAIGEDVVVIGAPKGLEFSLSRGVMSQLREKGDFLQVDAAVNSGNSGGPLFDKTGCVVGVVTFKSKESEGLNFAIAYRPAKHFLDNPAIERPARAAVLSSGHKLEPWKEWKTIYEPRVNGRSGDYSILGSSVGRTGNTVTFQAMHGLKGEVGTTAECFVDCKNHVALVMTEGKRHEFMQYSCGWGPLGYSDARACELYMSLTVSEDLKRFVQGIHSAVYSTLCRNGSPRPGMPILKVTYPIGGPYLG